jgi:NitT/TauT family transport system permease protein
VDTELSKHHRRERWLPAAVTLLVLAAWECLARWGAISRLFFPPPSAIVGSLAGLATNGELWPHLGATLSRLLVGLVVGGLPGFLLGLAMGWSRRLRGLVDPFIAATHPIPKLAILPLIMIIFGIGEASKVVTVAVATFFPLAINTMAGVRQISPIYFEVAENYGAGALKLFTRVVVPGSLPLVLAGVRLALNIALLITIAVEMVAAREGLGEMIWFAWETLRTEELYASLIVIAVLGIAINSLLQWLAARMLPWQAEREPWP